MDTPQEVQVWLILPALRRQLSLALKKKGMRQKEIALSLNLTEAAVSQYLKKKRGEEISFKKDLLKDISGSANKIINKKSSVRAELQSLLKKSKDNKFMCSVCNDHTESEKGCEICFM